ncbi:MAG: Gfo/Idh/MocA family oxidoreductase [Gammaproteobacteria bacterium]
MARELRVALIGYGLGGRAFHAPLIAVTPGLRLATIVTSNAERRAEASRTFPAVHIADSADWVWANAGAHDLAVITTPNRFHVPLARAAIAARIAVVVDKPLAATSREARDVVDEARRQGVPLTAYHNRRWDGELLTAQKLIASGELGEISRFESRLDRWRPGPPPAVWREGGAPEDAGGILYDLGPHLLDQARVLFGPVAQLYSELDRRRPGVAVEDDVFIALKHANGVHSHLWASSVAAQPGPRLRVMGSKAAYIKEHTDVQEAMLRAGTLPDAAGFGEDPRERWGLLGAGTDARPVQTEKGNYRRFYELAAAWLRDGGEPPVNPEDAVAVLELIEAARVSSGEGRTVCGAGSGFM